MEGTLVTLIIIKLQYLYTHYGLLRAEITTGCYKSTVESTNLLLVGIQGKLIIDKKCLWNHTVDLKLKLF